MSVIRLQPSGVAIPEQRRAASPVDSLRRRVAGPVLLEGDEDLAAEVACWNLAVRHDPAVVVGAACTADVVAAVRWAVEQGLHVAVQATGHGPVRDAAGSLMITTRRMQGIHIDAGRRTARVQAGVPWDAVMAAAAEHGLAGLRGSSSGVGVVGYTLGGGLGSFGRKHGFAADHVRAVEMVTADGRLRRVTAESEPELFWAIRGGKGNFGIVTEMEFDLVPAERLVAGGVFFAGADAAAVLHAFREWAPTMPEEVGTSIAILRVPPMEELPPPLRGQTVVHLRYAYCGDDAAEGARLVEPMLRAGTVLLGGVGPMPVGAMDAIHMDPVDPTPACEKGMLLADLPADAVDALIAAAGPQVELPLIMVELRLLGGALSRQPETPNAVAGRDAAWSAFALAPGVPELAQVAPAVVRGVLDALRPWAAPGCLVNFLGDVSGAEEVAAAYPPATAERLLALKRVLDPAGTFSFGHALTPRG
ncbi:MAG: FAD-binding oxidoreductase [Actinomycetes bacterium]